MRLSDLYPSFTLEDEWGRTLKITARQSMYTREVISPQLPSDALGSEQALNKTQFAMLLLAKIEELYNSDDPLWDQKEPDNKKPDTPDLDDWFGPRRRS